MKSFQQSLPACAALVVMACVALFSPVAVSAQSAPDPNFYIYLCFGQSNMEGNAEAEAVDKTSIGNRFQMLATTNFDSPKRTLGQWYAAVPPIVSPVGKLGPTDYFGRTMVAALPKEVKVGVVAVAMGGSPIEMFDKDKFQKKLSDNPNEWWAIIAKQHYGGNPYQRLIDMAKKAQEKGVIKGILLHQGCSNNGDPNWPTMVKKIYNDMLTDLGLKAADVPLFVGETLRQEEGGACWHHNSVVAKMPNVVPTSHVISSEGCPGNGNDPWHFNQLGYRLIGRRYAEAALQLMGLECMAQPDYSMPSSMKKFYCVRSLSLPDQLVAVPGQRIQVVATYQDGHTEDVSAAVSYAAAEPAFNSTGHLPSVGEFQADVQASFTDFSRKEFSKTIPMDVRYFPFDATCLKPIVGQGTLLASERTIEFNAGATVGWLYNEGVDLSAYKYLVVELAEPQTIGAQIRIFGQNTDFTTNYSQTLITTKTQLGIKLNGLKAAGKKLPATDIRAITFFAPKAGRLHIADVYLCNNDDLLPDGIRPLLVQPSLPASEPVFDLGGKQVGTAGRMHALPKGVYVVGGRKVVL